MRDKYYILDAAKQTFVAVKLLTLTLRVDVNYTNEGKVIIVFRKYATCTYKRADNPNETLTGAYDMRLYTSPDGSSDPTYPGELTGWTAEAGNLLRQRGYWAWNSSLAKPSHLESVSFEYDILNGTLTALYMDGTNVFPTAQAARDAHPVGVIEFEDAAPTREYIVESTTTRTYKVSATSKDAALEQIRSGKVPSQEVETHINARLKPSKKAPSKKASR